MATKDMIFSSYNYVHYNVIKSKKRNVQRQKSSLTIFHGLKVKSNPDPRHLPGTSGTISGL